MKTNGHNPAPNPQPPTPDLLIPGLDDDAYAPLLMRLDCYEDYILARKYQNGTPGAFECLDPLDALTAIADLAIGTPLLPPGCLFWQRQGGSERLAIYAGPQVWAVHVSDGGKAREHLRVPMPGLVWVGQGTTYNLYVVKSGGQGSGVRGQFWPTAETELFKAPCPNVGQDICQGSAQFPAAGTATMWPALRLFFESDFNNHLSNGKSKKHKDSVLTAWRELAGKKVWPEGDLVSAGRTVGDLVKG